MATGSKQPPNAVSGTMHIRGKNQCAPAARRHSLDRTSEGIADE